METYVSKEEKNMNNIPVMKVGIVGVSRDCFPASLTENRLNALVEAYSKKYSADDIFRAPTMPTIFSGLPRLSLSLRPIW